MRPVPALVTLIALTAVLSASAPANALLGTDEMVVPTPRAGDVGLYEVDGFTLDGEEARLAHRDASIAFEVGPPEVVEDAYSEDRKAHPITFEVLQGQASDDTREDGGTYVAWRDHRTEPPLVQKTTALRADQKALGPGIQQSGSAEQRVRVMASRTFTLNGPSCPLIHDLQGETVEEEGPIELVGCGDVNRTFTQDAIGQEVVEVRQLEDGRRSTHVRLTDLTDEGNMTVDIWYRDDIPYPVEITFEGTIAGDDSPEHEMEFEYTTISRSASLLLNQAFLPEWIPHENLTWDRTGDEKVPLEGSLSLARFEAGQGTPVPDGERTPWADEHPALEWGRPGTWGPPAGGETFNYSLEEVVEAIRLDPTLSEFQAWLEDHPDHQLVSASHRTWVQNGEESQRWHLFVGAPGTSGWWVQSERTTGVRSPDLRVPAEAPASENTATRLEAHLSTEESERRTPTIHSAIELWRAESAAGQEGKPATSFSWVQWSNGSTMLVGRGIVSLGLVPTASDPTTIGGGIDISNLYLNGDDGAVHFLSEGGVSWEYASVDGTDRSTGWDAPPTGDVGQTALSAPIVATLAATGGLALLLLLAAKLGVLPFYSRLKDDELLDNEARRRVYEAIGQAPGRSLSEIAETTGIARSTARYHLRRLDDGDLTTSVKGPDARRFFQAGELEEAQMQREAILATGRTREVYEAIREQPAASLTEICEATGMAASSTHRVVDRLVDAGLVQREREGRRVALHSTD